MLIHGLQRYGAGEPPPEPVEPCLGDWGPVRGPCLWQGMYTSHVAKGLHHSYYIHGEPLVVLLQRVSGD